MVSELKKMEKAKRHAIAVLFIIQVLKVFVVYIYKFRIFFEKSSHTSC